MVDTVTYEVRPFAMYFMMPGQVHSWTFSEDIEGFYIYFTLEFYKLYVRDRTMQKFPYSMLYALDTYTQFDPEKHYVIKAVLQDMYLEFQERPLGWEDILRNALDIVLIHIARFSSPSPGVTGFQKPLIIIRDLQALIEKHFVEYKLPSYYADKLHVTPKYLNAQCKLALNKTVTELIQERTILEAKRYLVYTEQSIKQITSALGFSDISYFMRFFKKLTKQTPDQFRKSFTYVKSVRREKLI